MTGLQTIIILGILLVASVAGNLYQWRQSAVDEAVHEVQTQVVVDANESANQAVTAVETDRDECQARLTTQHESLQEIITSARNKRTAAQAKAEKLAAALADERQSPECKAWRKQPSCGVGVWQ